MHEDHSRGGGSAGGSKKSAAEGAAALERIALVGNPNVGKSVIFGLLTGKYVTVSNYPGTTVEVTHGNVDLDGKKFLLVDTPGVNSLMPMSEDEKVTRDILLLERPAAVLQVGDAKNLKRTLLLTIQLAEMGLPVVLDVNMQDEAMDLGITVDLNALKSFVGTEVVGTVAPERRGINELRSAIRGGAAKVPSLEVDYGDLLEEYIAKVLALLPEANISRRSLATMILAGDESLRGWLKANLSGEDLDAIEELREDCDRRLRQPVGFVVAEARLRRAEEITSAVTVRTQAQGGTFASHFGRLSMHPVWGMPILLLVLFGLYEFVGVFGAGTLVDFMEGVIFDEYLIPMFTKVIETIVPVTLIQEMLVGEYGVITMAMTYAIGIILPITTTFFIAFAILEDSGYLPRLAIMSNRVFNIMGLSGKAVLPMVLGLGCGTMAVMTSRILETRRDRVIATFLLALAVPCAAQLGVIMGILGSLSAAAMAVWVSTIVGVLMLSGYLASKIVRGDRGDLFLEIPPIRRPVLSNVLIKTYNRAVWYLKEALPLFVLGTFILFVLDKLELLGMIEQFASPVVVGLLGLPEKATEAFLLGFLRRDYGAAGLFALFDAGQLSPVQAVVGLVTITLFVPCLAHMLMMIKERGMRLSLTIMSIVFTMAFVVGGALNWGLRALNITL